MAVARVRASITALAWFSLVTVVGCERPSPPGGGAPRAGHVFIVTEENQDYAAVIGNPSMPYLNSLAQQHGLATEYYANTHPSIGNYFMLATGQIITNDDSYSTIVTKNLVPYAQFAIDLANGALPDYVNIVPNLCHDAHDCSLDTADTWLRNNIAPLLASAVFQRDGLLIITFDESGSDNTRGGGRIAWIVVGPKTKATYQSTMVYQHEGTLRLTLEALGITHFPGAAAATPAMAEFFTP